MRSTLRTLGLLTMLALVLSACGSAPAATTASTAPAASAADNTAASTPAAASEAPAASQAAASQAAATGTKTKIAMWADPPDTGTANCFADTLIKAFNAQSATVQVDFVEQPNSWDATRTALSGGSGPDIVTTPGPSFAYELAKAGQLVPLDEYVTKNGWSESFLPWALNLGKVDNKLYSIPNELETLVLYYNKTLFEKNGWQPPKTMDELMTLSATIKAAGIIPFAHGNADWRPTNEWFVGEFLNHGAGPQAVYEALSGKRQWDDPAFAEPLEMLNQMQQNGYFMGGLDRYYTAMADERHTAFGKGEAAMNLEGTWFLGDVDKYFGEAAGNQNEWDWVPVPSKTGDEIYDLGIGGTYSINKATKNPEAVGEFLKYLFEPAQQVTLLATCGSAPAPVRLPADSLSQLDPRVARTREGIIRASDTNNYGYTTWTFWPPKSDTYLYEEVEKVWAKQTDTQGYLAGLQKQFADEFKAGDVPPLPPR